MVKGKVGKFDNFFFQNQERVRKLYFWWKKIQKWPKSQRIWFFLTILYTKLQFFKKTTSVKWVKKATIGEFIDSFSKYSFALSVNEKLRNLLRYVGTLLKYNKLLPQNFIRAVCVKRGTMCYQHVILLRLPIVMPSHSCMLGLWY